ncbi:hypothetical protein [Amycolatopsis sp. H20-H5]|uniref:hypothetical protein n=1 Tax=Amycolatopsis sp. H20-H5 TaxID=3046309 RepID=UPI002DBC1464|nr:hypothetical protein [Amycolatopsis sp. H20-H5]MEC3982672.1 hypothetical protein [Amycolatopsis sp. H20-H5]
MTVTRASAPRHRSTFVLLALTLFLLTLATPTRSAPGHGTDPVAVLAQQPLPHSVTAQPIPLAALPEVARVAAAPGFTGELVVPLTPAAVHRPSIWITARAPPAA